MSDAEYARKLDELDRLPDRRTAARLHSDLAQLASGSADLDAAAALKDVVAERFLHVDMLAGLHGPN